MPSSYFLINPSEACMRCKRVRSGRLFADSSFCFLQLTSSTARVVGKERAAAVHSYGFFKICIVLSILFQLYWVKVKLQMQKKSGNGRTLQFLY
jgi:hypothetical protein